MHRSSKVTSDAHATVSVSWTDVRSLNEWLSSQPTSEWKQQFERDGYLVVTELVNEDELKQYREIYDDMLKGRIETSNHRHDLGNHVAPKTDEENICQIMWPSLYVDNLTNGPIHQRTHAVAKHLLGEDAEFDFDMLISKGPHTNTATPWHQDESYWPDMPDMRAVTCWVPMEDVNEDNGCMWFIPKSHCNLREARPAKPGCQVLTCDGSEEEGKAVPILAGSATFHHQRTCHYTRGNTTDQSRRAFITNFRPAAMVTLERQLGCDHLKKGIQDLAKTKVHDVTS